MPARTRHDLDRAVQQLRDRFAYRPARRGPADPKWAWTDTAAQGCEASIREVLADAARASIDVDAVQRRSRAALEVAHELLTSGDTLSPTPAGATRRRSPRREVLEDASRAMRFAYADPPYPGRARYYPERTEVDHQALVERLVAEFPDGWALSTSAEALQQVLALCPGGVRVCAWQRAVRPARSRRPISAWEPLVVHGGRELLLDEPQAVRDALAYGGRFRGFPGAITG